MKQFVCAVSLAILVLAPFVLSGCGDMEASRPAVIEETATTNPLAQAWDPSGWQLAILREAKYALSQRMDGTSANIYKFGSGYYYVGDWAYVTSDPTGCGLLTGTYGWAWIDNDGHHLHVGLGGQCKFFANLVQWRATGGAKGCLPANTSATGSTDHVEPSDIIQVPQYVGHTAIVVAILERYADGRVKTVDVIDSNFIGGDGRFIIARHPITRTGNGGVSDLNSYRTYH